MATLKITSAQQLYVAYYGRPGDPAGVAFWNTQVGANNDYDAIANAFGNSAEAIALFAGLTNAERIEVVYQNILGRPADAPGLAFYVAELTAGRLTLANIAVAIVEGIEEGSSDATRFGNKVLSAGLFTTGLEASGFADNYAGQESIDIARAFLAGVTDTPATLAEVQTAIEQATGQVPIPGETFALTTGADIISDSSAVQTGIETGARFTDRNDIVNAVIDGPVNSTLNTIDELTDPSNTDQDTLNVTLNTSVVGLAPTLSRIETLAFVTTNQAAIQVINFTNITEVNQVVVTGNPAGPRTLGIFNITDSGLSVVDSSAAGANLNIGVNATDYAVALTFTGGAGNDTIVGGFLADTLVGGEGANSLVGGAGNDSIIGGSGSDTLLGEAGNDFINGSTGNDLLDGGTGNDTLLGGEGNDTLIGDDGNDSLLGGAGDDAIAAGAGNDFVDSGAGNDTIAGIDGNNTLLGGAGNDLLFGGIGNDSLIGGDGNDSLAGNNGDDTLLGGDGNDLLFGGDGNDSLVGGNDNDSLLGGDGDDSLIGGTGDDTFNGNVGADVLTGGDGNDVFEIKNRDQTRNLGGFIIGNTTAVNIDSITDFSGNGAGTGDLILLSTDLNAFGAFAFTALTNAVVTTQTLATANSFTDIAGLALVASTAATAQILDLTVNAGSLAGRYLIANDGTAGVGFAPGNDDTIINITGITGVLNTQDFIFDAVA